jgi:hypothetical protein
MNLLKIVGLTVLLLLKQVWSLPQSAAACFRRRRRQTARNLAETERLDRIRHPAKYVGRA